MIMSDHHHRPSFGTRIVIGRARDSLEIKTWREEKMKNLKNIVATFIMISAFGTTFANAGIIIAKEGTSATTCSTSETSILERVTGRVLQGIIIAKTGIIIARDGIIIAKDGASSCNTELAKTGIIIA